MVKNTLQHKAIAWIVLLILIVFLGYLFYVFLPSWSWHIEHTEGRAEIESINKSAKSFTYSYFNKYKSETITNEREVEKMGDLVDISIGTTLPVTYSKYVSGYVRFKTLDQIPSLGLTVGVFILVLVGVILYVAVLLNKISLETLAGVKVESNEPKKRV